MADPLEVTEPTTTPAAVTMPSVARLLKVVSIVEGTSYLILMCAVFAKYVLDAPGEGGVPIMGPTHGVIFLVYAALVLVGREEQGWDAKHTVIALVLAAVPFGGFYVERRMITVPTSTPSPS
jgi:integral membrane protein